MTKTFLLSTVILATAVWMSAQETPDLEKEFVREIKGLAKDKHIQRAFDAIAAQEAQTMNDLITLTEIPAPPFQEAARGKAFVAMLREAGVDSVWVDSVGNVLALRKGASMGSGLIAVDAHLDTVFPEGTDVSVQKVGDTLKAPGIGDDTRGLVMMLSMLRAMNTANLKTEKNILWVGSVGEEGLGDLRGMKYLFHKSDLPIEAMIAIDGGGLGRISNAGLGSRRYRLTVRGAGGHSWGSFGLANPHHALGRVIGSFSKAAWTYTSGDVPKTSFNVGRMGGGTSVNSIPFESWMEVDMRALEPENLDAIEAIFKQSVEEAIADYNASGVDGEVTYQLDQIGDRPSGELPPTLPLIQRTMAATQYFGIAPELGRGSTNINIPVSMGIPAVCIGRGGQGGGAHSLHEWYLNDAEGPKAIQLALLITVAQAGIAD